MPVIKSAKKRVAQAEKKRARNYNRKSDVKTAVKKFLDAVAEKNVDQAKELLREAQAKLARAGSKGVLTRKAVSRKLSRLAKKVATIAQ